MSGIAPEVGAGDLFSYVLRLGDLSLVLGQRLGEWVGHAPALEEDLGLANIALDLIGQARLLLELCGRGRRPRTRRRSDRLSARPGCLLERDIGGTAERRFPDGPSFVRC